LVNIKIKKEYTVLIPVILRLFHKLCFTHSEI